MLLISPAQALLQAHKLVAPDNNVIHQVNIEKFRGLHQLFSYSDILR
jgi:aconitase A